MYDLFYNPKSSQKTSFRIVSSNCRLPTRALEVLAITPKERQGVEEALSSFNAKATFAAASRLEYDANASNEAEGLYSYRINAEPDRGAKILTDLHQEILRELGAERGNQLCAALDLSFGPIVLSKLDATFEVKVPQSEGADMTYVHYTTFNPETGGIVGKGYSTKEPFKSRFGDILIIDKW